MLNFVHMEYIFR